MSTDERGSRVGSTRRAVSLVIGAVTAAAVLAVPTAAEAQFSAGDAAALSVTSDTLAPATSVTATARCRGNSGNYAAGVSWTPTTDSYATGYTVTLTPPTGAASTASVSGAATASAVVSMPAGGTAYTVTVTTTFRLWTSIVAAAPGTVSC